MQRRGEISHINVYEQLMQRTSKEWVTHSLLLGSAAVSIAAAGASIV